MNDNDQLQSEGREASPSISAQEPSCPDRSANSQPMDANPVSSGPAESNSAHPTKPAPCRYKVARLPEKIRNRINLMLRDSVSYAEILQKLGRRGQSLNKDCLSRWKKTGYKLWLQEQQRLHAMEARLQFFVDTVRQDQASKIHEASQQIAALQIAEMLSDLDPAAVKEAVQTDPASYIRMLAVLPRLSDGGLACQRHRVEISERMVKLKKDKRPLKRGISAASLKEMTEKLRLGVERVWCQC